MQSVLSSLCWDGETKALSDPTVPVHKGTAVGPVQPTAGTHKLVPEKATVWRDRVRIKLEPRRHPFLVCFSFPGYMCYQVQGTSVHMVPRLKTSVTYSKRESKM